MEKKSALVTLTEENKSLREQNMEHSETMTAMRLELTCVANERARLKVEN